MLAAPRIRSPDVGVAHLQTPFGLREEEYEVEAVINSRMFRGRLHTSFQWKGYSYEHNSWEDATDVHSPELISEFTPLIPELHARYVELI